MIQLNLLPDVKLDYIKAQRTRRLVSTVSAITTIATVAILLILLSYGGLQKKHLNDLTKDINNESRQLQKQPNITQILTVQNQLQSLTALHSAKPAASRLFDYLNSVTPAQVDIATLNIDFSDHTATITGAADALSSVNKYVDTLKFTTYTSDSTTTSKPAFSNIVLTSFGLASGQQAQTQAQNNRPATYTITIAYDQNIFDITQKVNLSVPNLISTRNQVAQPTDLFHKSTSTTGNGGKR